MPRRDPEHMSAQRERILRSVVACIADTGVERMSIADIRRKAGLSAGALYVHFVNKDDMVAEALRYGSMTEAALPDTWAEFVKLASSQQEQMGFDIETVVRTRLHLHAESVHPGPLHDVYKPILANSLDVLTERLRTLEARSEIRLRMGARQTAMSMNALIDGMLWIALASDRPLEELEPELSQALSCLVEVCQRNADLSPL